MRVKLLVHIDMVASMYDNDCSYKYAVFCAILTKRELLKDK